MLPGRKHTSNFKDRLLQELILADYRWKNGLLKLMGKLLFRKTPPGSIRRILLYRRGGIGDSITALPALERIRKAFPQAELDLLTHKPQSWQPGLAQVAPEGSFRQVITYDTFNVREIAGRIAEGKYDLFLTLPNYHVSLYFELRSMMMARLACIPSGMGWHISSTRFMARQQQRLLNFRYDKDRLLECLDDMGLPPAIDTTASEQQEQTSGDGHMIALVISAGRSQNNWPAQNFAFLARQLTDSGYEVYLLGGSREKDQAEIIRKFAPEAHDLCGNMELEEYRSFFSRCRLIIGNDTGIMHLAYATATPVITLFSARDYAGKWFPQDRPDSISMRSDNISCAQCFSETCADNKCIQRISPESVLAHALQLLSASIPVEVRA